MSASPPTTYSEWTKALADRYFRPEYANTHVMYCVDRVAIAELAESDEDDAVNAFVTCVSRQLRTREPRRLFEPVRKKAIHWKREGGDDPPPCLPVLALTVLAASEMRQEGERAGHNYYEWLFDLLRGANLSFKTRDVEYAYREEVPGLWRQLQWWLDEKMAGNLGFHTIVDDDNWTKIGYADSQTLFQSSDRDKLTQFLSWIELEPGSDMPEQDLVQYFRHWSQGRDDLNLGTLTMLEEDAVPRQLADLLVAAAKRWRGVEQDSAGRKFSRLTLALKGPPKPELRLRASRPPGFPPKVLVSYQGRQMTLECHEEPGNGEDAWYQGVDLDVTRNALDKGVEMSGEGVAFKLPPSEFHILQRNGALQRWASVESIRPAEKAWLLAKRDILDLLFPFLEQFASQKGEEVQVPGIAPEGWVLIRDVVIDPITEGSIPDQLRRLAPRTGNRLRLSGGLPMPHGRRSVFLLGAPPDVQVPPRAGEISDWQLEVDGEPVPLQGAETARLINRQLGVGNHEVRLGDISLSFSLIDGGSEIAPKSGSPISHRIQMRDQGPPVALTEGAAVRDSSELDTPGVVEVEGALLAGGAPTRGSHRPVILHSHVEEGVLIGARPGQLEFVECPPQPHWMSSAGLYYRVFEHVPRFPVAWLVTKGFLGKRARQVEPLEPDNTEADGNSDEIEEWLRTLEWAANAETPPAEQAAFQRFVETAKRQLNA